MNINYLFLGFSCLISLTFSMELPTEISLELQQQIFANKNTAREAANTFNELYEKGHLEGTTANISWCINSLSIKFLTSEHDAWRKTSIFAMARLIKPCLATKWMTHYLKDQSQLDCAIEELNFTIDCDQNETAQFLLDSSKNLINETSIWPTTCVYNAVLKRRPKILGLLLHTSADPDQYCQWMHHYETPLNLATRSRNLETVLLLLQSGANPNLGTITTGCHTPLLVAVFENYKSPHSEYLTITQALINYGADRTATTSTGTSAWFLANRDNDGGLKGQMQQLLIAKHKIP
ncbi:hypothetical protein BH09DEP1_BH09DEP1_0050 [soil metagenome]